jgi:hypothetical protein
MSLDNHQQVMLELKALGERHKAFIADQKQSFNTLQTQVDHIDRKVQCGGDTGGGASYSGGDGLRELKSFLSSNREDLQKHGRLAFEVPTFLPEGKTTILSTGLTSSEHASGVQGFGRFAYRLRTLFKSIPTQLPSIGVLRSTTETLNVSPQVEGQPKGESTMAFNLVQVPVQVFASWITCSRQAMDDLDSFGAFINATLLWALEKKAESEILSGDGTGVNLPGLVNTATAFDTTILPSDGWNKVDALGAASTQLIEAGFSPDFAVISPRNWFRMTSLRGSTGFYVLGPPTTAIGERAYSLQVLPSPAMLGDGFLVGDSTKAQIRQRTNASVVVSYENANNFTSNLVTVLAEERFGIETLRPDAYIQGSLTTSPA